MKKVSVLIIISIMIFIIGCNNGQLDNTETDFEKKWELIFEDEFDGTALNLDNWKINTMLTEDPEINGTRRAGYYANDEDDIYLDNGNLYIQTKYKNGIYGEGWYSGFLESSINTAEYLTDRATYKGFAHTYGYYEIRCKVPPAEGIWSAFWLMPDNYLSFSEEDIQWSGADGAEIDIMESPNYYNIFNKNFNTHAIHGDSYGSGLKSDKSKAVNVPDMYTQFHTYAMEWNENEYIFYIDNIETWRTKHSFIDPLTNEMRELGVSKVNEYLILSVEVGGIRENGEMIPGYTRNSEGDLEHYWCGNPDNNDKSLNYDFVVDYVRVYELKTK